MYKISIVLIALIASCATPSIQCFKEMHTRNMSGPDGHMRYHMSVDACGDMRAPSQPGSISI